MKKWQIKNLSEISEISEQEKSIPNFLISELSILAVGPNQKLGFKNLGKNFPRFLRFPMFPSFQLGYYDSQFLRKVGKILRFVTYRLQLHG